jgi:flagellar motor switch protein FliN/FliY
MGANDDIDFGSEEEMNADIPELERRNQTVENKRRRAIFSVPVEVLVSVGKARPMVGELLNMRREAILQLDTKISDPVEIWVGERIIARGELQEMDDGSGRLSVRLTEVMELDMAF